MSAQYISIDDQKKRIPGYKPEEAEKYHQESAKAADKLFADALKHDPSDTVILLCGGSASGKSEFCLSHLTDEDAIIYDGTLPTIAGAKIKLRNIEKNGKKAMVYVIIPDDLHRAFKAFLGRERRFQPEHFYRTHAGSRQTLLWVATARMHVPVRIFESSYGDDGRLRFRPLTFENHQALIDYLWENQYNEQQIANLVHPL